jgi:hypothetical protein
LFGATFASVNALPPVSAYVQAQLKYLLPDSETFDQMERDWQVLVLQIDDVRQAGVVDWRLKTPHFYQFTAQVAVEVARCVALGGHTGWTTTSEVLGEVSFDSVGGDVSRGCHLQRRLG